jgi:anti-sigma-K factor RskA
MAPKIRHADTWTMSRWYLGIVALAPRRCCACACRHRYADTSAGAYRHQHAAALDMTALSRWRIAVVAMAHVGIVALRLSIAAMAWR